MSNDQPSFRELIQEYASQLCKQRKVLRGNLKDDQWSRVKSGILGVLGAFDYSIDASDKAISLNDPEPTRFESEFFRPYDQIESKDKIGKLVAYFLRYVKDRNVLLGSGSTVYHVGKNMIKLVEQHPTLKRYRQLFWTVNLALAAELSITDKDVISRVSIPEGQLRTMTFRFSRIRRPEWYCPIAVVSADGCYFEPSKIDGEPPEANLYANEVAVAENTNLFIDQAVDTVICCLSSSKLEYRAGNGQNAGPPIKKPSDDPKKKGVNWYLVTDKKLGEMETQSLTRSNWKIITKLDDWLDGKKSIRDLGEPFWQKEEF